MNSKRHRIDAVLFDFDGTLTQPGTLDLKKLRTQIGCPAEAYILEYIDGLTSTRHQQQAMAALTEHEMAAANQARPNAGAEALIRFLRNRQVPIGIISRNSRRSIERSLHNFNQVTAEDFDLILSRDDPLMPKPSGEGPRHAAAVLGVDPAATLLVGDFILDMQSGRRAGMQTALLITPDMPIPNDIDRDYTIGHLDEIKNLIQFGSPLAAGKLPNRFLDDFLNRFDIVDPSVLIKPGIGEDTAAIDIAPEEVLALKSDPITFATDSIGNYAVLVNANDVATAGARPRWFLTTLLFPIGTGTAEIRQVMQELYEVSRHWGITLCGGHTEITDAVTRPVVTGMMVGTVARSDLVDKRNVRTGDVVLLTKGVAVEGTAIIAREFGEKLVASGMAPEDIDACRNFLASISVLSEAEIAAGFEAVSAMHDVTEGGLATALDELSIAGGHQIRVQLDRIPVFAETTRICRLLKLDPLGLIGSGSLLICCRPQFSRALIAAIEARRIQVTPIGEVRAPGGGIEAVSGGRKKPWPKFEVDEITRLFN